MADPQNDPQADLHRMQQRLVDSLVEAGTIRSPAVENAFRYVPRHLFVPQATPERAYSDSVIVIKTAEDSQQAISSSSQPTMMALMLEQLGLEPGQRVLEIGAGSGYNAALMAHLVGAGGAVTAMDIDTDLVEGAREHVAAAGYADRVRVVQGDGTEGYPPDAPYDRVILTVAADDLSPAWAAQLTPDGRIVMPLILRDTQVAVALERAPDGDGFYSVAVTPCAFMPLRGDFAAGDGRQEVRLAKALIAAVDDRVDVDAKTLRRLLRGSYQDLATGFTVTARHVRRFQQWLTLHQAGGVILHVDGAQADVNGRVPLLAGAQGRFRMAQGMLTTDSGRVNGLVLAMQPPGTTLPAEADFDTPFALHLRVFGPQGRALARQMVGQLSRWLEAGQPDTGDLHLRLFPHDRAASIPPQALALRRRWHTLLLTFDDRA